MTIYTNQFSGAVVSPAQVSYGFFNIAVSPLRFEWPVAFIDSSNVLGDISEVQSALVGTRAIMPPANQVSVGQSVLFVNHGANSVSIRLNDDTTPLITLAAGNSTYCYLIDNTTTNVVLGTTYYIGTWEAIPFGGGVAAVTSIGATSLNTNLTIAGTPTNPITGAGTFTFNLANDLLRLASFGSSQGFAARTGTNTWELRQLTGTANQIQITNPSGMAASPVFSLAANITGLTSVKVSNINIGLDSSNNPAQNTIASSNTNGNLVWDPNGAGEVQSTKNIHLLLGKSLKFQNPAGTQFISFEAGNLTSSLSFIWPTTVPTVSQVLQYSGGNNLSWASVTTFGGPSTVDAIARYSNTSGSLTNSVVLISGSGFITGATGITAGNITITTSGSNTITTSSGDLVLNPNGASETKTFNNITIQNQNALKLSAGTPGNFIGFKAAGPLSLTTSTTFTLPTGDGQFGDVFAVTNGSAVLSTATIPGRNRLTNGGFPIWQKGNSFSLTVAGNSAIADGWAAKVSGAPNVTVSKANYTGFSSTVSPRFLMKVQRTAGNTDTNPIIVCQTIPIQDCGELAGNYITITILMLAGANFSANASNANVSLFSGTQVSNVGFLGGGFTGTVTELNSTFAISTSLTRYSFTTSAPIQAGTTQLALQISYTPVGTAGADDSFYIGDAQLEKGISGTPFERLPYALEIKRVERFYCTSFENLTAPAQNIGIDTGEIVFISTVAAGGVRSGTIHFPSRMLGSNPTITLYNPSAANAQIRNETRSEDLSLSAVLFSSDTGFVATGVASASTVAGDILGVHYTADNWLI